MRGGVFISMDWPRSFFTLSSTGVMNRTIHLIVAYSYMPKGLYIRLGVLERNNSCETELAPEYQVDHAKVSNS